MIVAQYITEEREIIMNIKWDAEDYSERFSFVPSYGEDMLSLLNVKPGAFCD